MVKFHNPQSARHRHRYALWFAIQGSNSKFGGARPISPCSLHLSRYFDCVLSRTQNPLSSTSDRPTSNYFATNCGSLAIAHLFRLEREPTASSKRTNTKTPFPAGSLQSYHSRLSWIRSCFSFDLCIILYCSIFCIHFDRLQILLALGTGAHPPFSNRTDSTRPIRYRLRSVVSRFSASSSCYKTHLHKLTSTNVICFSIGQVADKRSRVSIRTSVEIRHGPVRWSAGTHASIHPPIALKTSDTLLPALIDCLSDTSSFDRFARPARIDSASPARTLVSPRYDTARFAGSARTLRLTDLAPAYAFEELGSFLHSLCDPSSQSTRPSVGLHGVAADFRKFERPVPF